MSNSSNLIHKGYYTNKVFSLFLVSIFIPFSIKYLLGLNLILILVITTCVSLVLYYVLFSWFAYKVYIYDSGIKIISIKSEIFFENSKIKKVQFVAIPKSGWNIRFDLFDKSYLMPVGSKKSGEKIIEHFSNQGIETYTNLDYIY